MFRDLYDVFGQFYNNSFNPQAQLDCFGIGKLVIFMSMW